jgi:nucleotide-binding universal stress UspA family protein
MNNEDISILHHLRAVTENNAALRFLASILHGRAGRLDMVYVEEILDRITDEARRDLAEEQRDQEERPSPEEVTTLAERTMDEAVPQYELKTLSTSGDPVKQVLNQLEKEDYDLLSLEAYGKGGFRKNILGAHVNQIVRQSPVPTLVHKGELTSCERVLIHVPNDRERSTRLVSYLANLLEGSKPAITFLAILSEEGEKFEGYTSGEEEYLMESLENYAREEFDYLDPAQEIIAERGMEAEVRYRTGEIQEEILAEAKEGRYDIMSFSPEKQNILTSLWSGDKSLEVMRGIDISVLKFPPPE